MGSESVDEVHAADADATLRPGALEGTVGYRLRFVQIAAYRAFEKQLGRYGAAPRYLGLLAVIQHNPGQPQSRLAEAVALSRSTLVPIIDRLEAERLVERKPSPLDRRYKSVWLTPRGRKVVAELTAEAQAHEDRLCAGLGAADRRTLVRLLGRIMTNLEQG